MCSVRGAGARVEEKLVVTYFQMCRSVGNVTRSPKSSTKFVLRPFAIERGSRLRVDHRCGDVDSFEG